MALRIPMTIVGFAAALAIGPSVESLPTANDSEALHFSPLARVTASTSDENSSAGLSQRTKDYLELLKGLESGQRTHDEIQNELKHIARSGKVIHWNSQQIKHSYKLTQVLAHTENTETQFQMLMFYTFPDKNIIESTVTQFTQKLNEPEVESIRSSVIFSRFLTATPNGIYADDASRAQFVYSASSNNLMNNSQLREPHGLVSFSRAQNDILDPLSLLSTDTGVFEEIGVYTYNILLSDLEREVTITPRKTDFDTLTIEVKIQTENSPHIQIFVLVYEEI